MHVHSKPRTRVLLVVIPLLFLFSSALPISAQAASTGGDAQVLDAVLEEAAREFRVPLSILRSISWMETGLRPASRHGGCHAESKIGIMGLRVRGTTGATVDSAASASDISSELIATDLDSNIRAGAAWLRVHVAPSTSPLDLMAWWEVVGMYGGGEGVAQELFAASVYDLIASGFSGRLMDGSVLEVPPYMAAEIAARVAGVRLMSQSSPDYAGALYVPACSENYTWANRGTNDIDYVVIHTIQGSYSGAIGWFANCAASVSAHYVISKGGEITQSLLEKHIGWHAGYWPYNEAGIGIEHEGYVDDPTNYTEAMYQASAALVAAICDKYGIPKTRDFIIGHNEVPGCPYSGGGGQGCHTDPGDYWDWDLFMSYVGGESGSGGNSGGDTSPQPQHGDLVGFVRDGDIYVGADVEGANLSLDTGAWTTTGPNGYFSFFEVPAGAHQLTVSAPGYITAMVTAHVEASIVNWSSVALEEVLDPEDPEDISEEPEDTIEEPEPGPNEMAEGEDGPTEVSAAEEDGEAEIPEGISERHWAPAGSGHTSASYPDGDATGADSSESGELGCTNTSGRHSSGWWWLFSLLVFLVAKRRLFFRRSVN